MMYKFKAKDVKVHFIDANNWEDAEREFIDNFIVKKADD